MRTLMRSVGWLVGGALAAGVLVQVALFYRIATLMVLDPWQTSFQHAQSHQVAGPLQHQAVPYDRISRHVKRAIIAAEDATFVDHPGIDIDALEKAWQKNKRRGRVVAGGSTITQQLAKNLYLSGERSYVRKAEEFVITFMLEFWLDKERILELYMNEVEWGVGVFGIEAAARHYYGIGADRLSAVQAARLAAMLPNPRYYDRNRQSAYLERRTATILGRMGAAQLP